MNNTYILLMLVNTLTKAEKRYFHLCANLQNGDKVYLTLFNLIDANTSPEQLYTRFCQIQDGKSFETAVKHLYRVLLAYIIHSGFISGYQNRYGDNLKPPTNVYHRMTA